MGAFEKLLFERHRTAIRFPKTGRICDWTDKLLSYLFPELCDCKIASEEELSEKLKGLEKELFDILNHMQVSLPEDPSYIADAFFKALPDTYSRMTEDVDAINMGDPAANNSLEVILTYPGFYAITFYRVAHALYELEVPLLPRIITEFASTKTGIEIHPGATIGKNFCIDHGSGVVIGSTCVIGDNVKVYQGVTLGALSVDKSMAGIKRHPTIEDNVVIYSGATILGGETTVGANSIIGGNVWLTKSVPENSVIYHHAQLKVRNQERESKEA